MALVRRSAIVGQLDRVMEKGASELSGAVATQLRPVTNGAASNGATATQPANGTTAGTAATTPIPSSPQSLADDAEAAAVASKGASVLGVLGAFLLVAVGTGIGYCIIRWGYHGGPFEIGDQVSAYAALVVFAGAVERILEPFSNLLPGARARARYETTVAALANGHPTASVSQVAAARAILDRALANRTVLMWGLATGVAAVVSAAGHFYLLHMIAAQTWSGQIPTWVDALVTGLVVGTGTKPLHDLITKVQSVKE